MGIGCSTLSAPNHILCYSTSVSNSTLKSKSKSLHNPTPFPINFRPPLLRSKTMSQSPIPSPLNCSKVESIETKQEISGRPMFDPHSIDPKLLQKLVYDALVWSSLHGLVVGDRAVQVCCFLVCCFKKI